jgi:hypothetical protein
VRTWSRSASFVAGVRDQFPVPVGQGAQEGGITAEASSVSGGQHAQGAVGGGEALFGDDAAEGGLEMAEG